MEVQNSLTPNQEQMAGFTEPGVDGPIYMLNLLKFRPKAEYADGRPSNLTGREAYGLYAQGVTQLIAELGGSIVFSAQIERLTIGEVEDLWDVAAIAMYPSRGPLRLPASASWPRIVKSRGASRQWETAGYCDGAVRIGTQCGWLVAA